MAQLENLKAHEKYNLLLCMVSGAYTYKGTIPGNEDFKELCDECTLGHFRSRRNKAAQHKYFELMRKADYHWHCELGCCGWPTVINEFYHSGLHDFKAL
ncbi:hypothetical protein HpMS13_12420 [Helicobacter pylori]